MSVHIVERKSGAAYEVRWRMAGANRSRRFDDEAEAVDFDEAVQARVALDRAEERWASIPAQWRSTIEQAVS
jgi:hypothetical protein